MTWGLCLMLEGAGHSIPVSANASPRSTSQTFPRARVPVSWLSRRPRERGRGTQYLDPVHWVMNDGGLRLLQKKEAQRKERAAVRRGGEQRPQAGAWREERAAAEQDGGRWPAGSVEQLERGLGRCRWNEQTSPGLEGTSDRRPIERLRLRAGVRSRTLGVPAPGALPSLCCAGPPAHHGQGTGLKMSWSGGGTWDGRVRDGAGYKAMGTSLSGLGATPTPALAVDVRLANLASQVVQGLTSAAGLGPRGDARWLFSKLIGPVDQQTATSWDCLCSTRHYRHAAAWQEGRATGHTLHHSPAPLTGLQIRLELVGPRDPAVCSLPPHQGNPWNLQAATGQHSQCSFVSPPVAHGLMGNTMAATALDPTATARLSPGKAKGSCLPPDHWVGSEAKARLIHSP